METPDRKQIEKFVALNKDWNLLDAINELRKYPIGSRYNKLPILIEAWAPFVLEYRLYSIFDSTKWEGPWPKVAEENEMPPDPHLDQKRYPKMPHRYFWEIIFDVFDLNPDSSVNLLKS